MKRKLAGFLMLVFTVLALLPLAAQAIMVEPDDNTCMYGGGEHTWSDWYTMEEATCIGTGSRQRYCNICQWTQTEVIPALGHDWDDWQYGDAAPTCTQDGSRIRYCRRCQASETGVAPALGHAWGEWSVVNAATCIAPGNSVRMCTRCGAEEGRDDSALGHSAETVAGKAATCTETGLTEGSKCSRCGAVLTAQTTIPALGHAMDGGAVTTAATCTSAGVKTYTCTRCGMTTTETIPATGHTPVAIPGIPATCTESGLTEGSKCSVCGAILTEQAYTPALGHDYEATEYKEATAAEDGYIKYVCSRCWDSYTEIITKLPHEHAYVVTAETPAACTSEGVRTYTCTICGNSYSESTPALGHAPQALPGKAPTCMEPGLTEGSVCSRCGVVLAAQTAIPAIGHNWGEWVVTKEATATADGQAMRTCKNDPGHTEYYTIPATGEPTEEANPALKLEIGLWVDRPDPLILWMGEVVSGQEAAVISSDDDIRLDYFTVDNTGNIPLLWKCVITTGDHTEILDSVELRRLFSGRLDPGKGRGKSEWDMHYGIHKESILPDPEDSPYAGTYTETWKVCGYALDDTEYTTPICESNAVTFEFKIAREPEEPNPSLDIVWRCDSIREVSKDFWYETTSPGILGAEDGACAWVDVINNGNIPLKVGGYKILGDGFIPSTDPWPLLILDPGEYWERGFGPRPLSNHITPGTETDDLLGTVTITIWAVGYDPETGEQLCETEHITRTWQVGKNGTVTPKPDPGKSQLVVSLSKAGDQADPSGYQLGEVWDTKITVKNIGQVDLVDDFTLHVDFITVDESIIQANQKLGWPTDGSSWYEVPIYCSDVMRFCAGEECDLYGVSPCGYITAEDVARGYVYVLASVRWIDPETGTERTASSAPLYLPVISKTGLLVKKGIEHGPENDAYFREGEAIPWTLTVTNNSNEPITNVTVTDQGAVVGTFAEIKPGETLPCSVPPHVVTEYEAKVVGTVSNMASAAGTDLQGNVHTWPSNPCSVPTNQFSPTPLPIPDDKEKDQDGGDGTGDPLPPGTPETPWTPGTPGGGEDPLGSVYGVTVGATVYKTTAHGPKNEKWYDEGEPVDYTITVKNIGEVAIENLKLYDSLGGLAPIDTWPSLAPNEEHTFTFQWVVNSDNIGDGYVVNQATLTYTFLGVNGTPRISNPVYVIAGEYGHLPMDGIILDGGETPEIPHFPGLTPDHAPTLTPVTGPDGSPVISPFGTPVMMLPDGTYCTVGPDGKTILTDKDGNPILDKNGNYIVIDPDGLASCSLTLESLGDAEARYTLHACTDHKAAAESAEAALQAGNAAEACRIWKEEIGHLYETLYEAGDTEGKAAVLEEKIAFDAYADQTAKRFGEKAAAEVLRIKCARLCCMIHTAPNALPESLSGTFAQQLITYGSSGETARSIAALIGYDSEMTETYGPAEASTLQEIVGLLQENSSWNFGEVFLRGGKLWQMALDRRVNAEYKAADPDGRKQIAAWRTGLDTLSASEKALTEMLYEGNEAVSAEIVMNLYKDAIFDNVKHAEAKENSKLNEFIARCYRYALGREASEPEIAYWADTVTDPGRTIADIARDILGSVEFQNRKLGNEEIVKALYRIYFDRDADEGGLAGWVNALNSGESLEAVEAGFTGSDEFKAIIGE